MLPLHRSILVRILIRGIAVQFKLVLAEIAVGDDGIFFVDFIGEVSSKVVERGRALVEPIVTDLS